MQERLRKFVAVTAEAMASAVAVVNSDISVDDEQRAKSREEEEFYADYTVLRINGFADAEQLEDVDERVEIINNIHSIFSSGGKVVDIQIGADSNDDERCGDSEPTELSGSVEQSEDGSVPIYVHFESFSVTRLCYDLISELVIGGTKLEARICHVVNLTDVLSLPPRQRNRTVAATSSSAESSARALSRYGVVMIKNIVEPTDTEDEESIIELMEDLRHLCSKSSEIEGAVTSPSVAATWVTKHKLHLPASIQHKDVNTESELSVLSPFDVLIEFDSLGRALRAMTNLSDVVIGGTQLSVRLYDYEAYVSGRFFERGLFPTQVSDQLIQSLKYEQSDPALLPGGEGLASYAVIMKRALDRTDWLINNIRNNLLGLLRETVGASSSEFTISAHEADEHQTTDGFEEIFVDICIHFQHVSEALDAYSIICDMINHHRKDNGDTDCFRAEIVEFRLCGRMSTDSTTQLDSGLIHDKGLLLAYHPVHKYNRSEGSTSLCACFLVQNYFTDEDELGSIYDEGGDVDSFIASKGDLATLATTRHPTTIMHDEGSQAGDNYDGLLRITPLALLTNENEPSQSSSGKVDDEDHNVLAGVATATYSDALKLMLKLDGSLVGGRRIEVTALSSSNLLKPDANALTVCLNGANINHGFNESYVNNLLFDAGGTTPPNDGVIGGAKYGDFVVGEAPGKLSSPAESQQTALADRQEKPKSKLELVKITPKQEKHVVGARPIPVRLRHTRT
jgi:hypothetical protein